MRSLMIATDKQAHSGDVIVTSPNIYLHLSSQRQQLCSCCADLSVVSDIVRLISQSSDCIFDVA